MTLLAGASPAAPRPPAFHPSGDPSCATLTAVLETIPPAGREPEADPVTELPGKEVATKPTDDTTMTICRSGRIQSVGRELLVREGG